MLEFAATFLRLALSEEALDLKFELGALIVYALITVSATVLSAISLRASAIGTVLFALPSILLGIAVVGAALIIGTNTGLLPSNDRGDLRQIGVAIIFLGVAIATFGVVALLEPAWTAFGAWLMRKLALPRHWASAHMGWMLLGVGVVLVAIGLLLSR